MTLPRRGMLVVLLRLILIYAAFVLVLALAQRKLLYFPDQDMKAPEAYELSGFQEVTLDTADGLKLKSWYAPPSATDGLVVVYFHGNGGHLGYRKNRYRAFQQAGFGVFALEYRGYGGNPGKPDEAGLYADARAALAYVRGIGIDESRIILLGESLGTGVAVQMATEITPALLFLESPFTSVAERAQELHWYIPAKWLVRDRFDTIGKISAITAPLLVMHGKADTVIPPEHGEQVLAAAPEPKRGIFLDGVEHTAIPAQQMADAIQAFVRERQSR